MTRSSRQVVETGISLTRLMIGMSGFDVTLDECRLVWARIGCDVWLLVATRTGEGLRYAPGEAEPAVAEALKHRFAVATP